MAISRLTSSGWLKKAALCANCRLMMSSRPCPVTATRNAVHHTPAELPIVALERPAGVLDVCKYTIGRRRGWGWQRGKYAEERTVEETACLTSSSYCLCSLLLRPRQIDDRDLQQAYARALAVPESGWQVALQLARGERGVRLTHGAGASTDPMIDVLVQCKPADASVPYHVRVA